MFCQWNCGWQPSAVITTILPYIYSTSRYSAGTHFDQPFTTCTQAGGRSQSVATHFGCCPRTVFLVKRQGWIFSYDDVLSIWETWDLPRFAFRCSFELFPHGKMFNRCSTWNLWNQRLQLHQRQTISGKIGWLDGCHLTYSALGVGQADYSMVVKMPRPLATSAWAWAHMLVHKPFQFFGIFIYTI